MTAEVPTAPGDVARHRVLSHGEVVRLAHLFKEGQAAGRELEDCVGLSDDHVEEKRRAVVRGLRARDLILVHNLRLVAHNARRYSVDGLTFDDHFQDGCRGLLRAAEKFDPDAGFRFSTYATWWIRQSITRGIADTARLIRLPVHLIDDLRRLDAARQRLIGGTGRAPLPELVIATGFSEEKVVRLRGLLPGPLSLDAVVGDGLTTLGDLLPAREDREDDRAELRAIVGDQLSALSDREREVVVLRFGLDGSEERTLEQVGNIFGVTRERIRQIESKALGKLRRGMAKALERPIPAAKDSGATPNEPLLQPDRAVADPALVDRLNEVRDELAPRGRRLLDELSATERGLTSAGVLEAIGLPTSAPIDPLLAAVDRSLAAAGLPTVERDGSLLVLAPSVAAAWHALTRSAEGDRAGD